MRCYIIGMILKHAFYFLGQDSLHLISIPSQPKDVNITGLLQKTEAISPVSNENKHVFSRTQEAFQQCEQKIAMYVTHMCFWGIWRICICLPIACEVL